METISVVFTPIGGAPGQFHGTLVYTNSAGQQFYEGATRSTWSTPASATQALQAEASELAGIGSDPLGTLISVSGSVTAAANQSGATQGWFNASNPSYTLFSGSNLSSQWSTISNTMSQVGSRGLDYAPLDQNSNSAWCTAALNAGATTNSLFAAQVASGTNAPGCGTYIATPSFPSSSAPTWASKVVVGSDAQGDTTYTDNQIYDGGQGQSTVVAVKNSAAVYEDTAPETSSLSSSSPALVNGNGASLSVSGYTIDMAPSSSLNLTGSNNAVSLNSGDALTATGGGNVLNNAGTGDAITVGGTNGNYDTINGSGIDSGYTAANGAATGLTIDASTQVNLQGSNNNVATATGDSLGAFGGGNQIVVAGSKEAIAVGNTDGSPDTISGSNDLTSSGAASNGQGGGISLGSSSQGTIAGNNDSGYGATYDRMVLDGTGNYWNANGTNLNLNYSGGTATLIGNQNTFDFADGGTIRVAGTQDILDGRAATIDLLNTGTSETINGNNNTINDSSSDTVSIDGQDDHDNGNSSDDVTFYGGNYTGDSESGGTPIEEGGSAPGGGSYGYGNYGYGYDFVAGSKPKALTSIAGISSFDAKVSSVGGSSVTPNATNNLARSEALSSAIASSEGASTLGTEFEGTRWTGGTVTWSFGNATFSSEEQAEIERAFNAWAQVSGITFQQVASPQSADISLGFNNFGTASSGVLGFTSYKTSNGSFQAGTTISLENPTQTAIVSGTGGLTYAGTGASFYQVVLHEIGHAIGVNDNADQSSVMYYGSSTSNQTLDQTDIESAQMLYGGPAHAAAESAAQPTASPSQDLPVTSEINVPLTTATLQQGAQTAGISTSSEATWSQATAPGASIPLAPVSAANSNVPADTARMIQEMAAMGGSGAVSSVPFTSIMNQASASHFASAH